MFDTHDTLHQALTRSGIWHGLYTALMASTPQLAVRSNCDDAEHCGLEFFEQRARVHNAPISGSVTMSLTSGAIIVRADGYTGPRWHSALDRLASAAETGWTWQPDADHEPGQLDGVLHPSFNVTAETTIGRSGGHEDNAQAGLALIPGAPEACETAWTLAVTALGVLVTDEPTYRSPVLAEPPRPPTTRPPSAPSPPPLNSLMRTSTSAPLAMKILGGPTRQKAGLCVPCATSATPSSTSRAPGSPARGPGMSTAVAAATARTRWRCDLP